MTKLEYDEYIEGVRIAEEEMKKQLLYPKEKVLYDLYAIPSHNHQAFYAVIVEKNDTFEMIYARTEIYVIDFEEPIKMYTFQDAKEANDKSNKDGRIIIGIAKVPDEFVEKMKKIDTNVSSGVYCYSERGYAVLDGCFQVIRFFDNSRINKEIVYDEVARIKTSDDIKEIMENIYIDVEKIITA